MQLMTSRFGPFGHFTVSQSDRKFVWDSDRKSDGASVGESVRQSVS